MAKFLQILLTVTLVACVVAEAPRTRFGRLQQRNRFLARQEIAVEEAVTPYPAAGIKPEIAFDLPTEQEEQQQPDNTYLPPDSTYGPPPAAAADVPFPEDVDAEIDPAVEDAEEDVAIAEEDEEDLAAEVGSTPVEQPAPVEESDYDENADVIPVVDSQSGRLVLGRRLRVAAKSGRLQQRRQVRARFVRL